MHTVSLTDGYKFINNLKKRLYKTRKFFSFISNELFLLIFFKKKYFKQFSSFKLRLIFPTLFPESDDTTSDAQE